MSDIFIKPDLNLTESSRKVLAEMLREVPADTATASVEVTKDGTTTVTVAARFKIGDEYSWALGVGGYLTKDSTGGVTKGVAVSVSW